MQEGDGETSRARRAAAHKAEKDAAAAFVAADQAERIAELEERNEDMEENSIRLEAAHSHIAQLSQVVVDLTETSEIPQGLQVYEFGDDASIASIPESTDSLLQNRTQARWERETHGAAHGAVPARKEE